MSWMFLILVYEQCSMDLSFDFWPDNLVNFLFFFPAFLPKMRVWAFDLWSLWKEMVRSCQVLYVQLCNNCRCSSSFTLYIYLLASIFGISVTQAIEFYRIHFPSGIWMHDLICFWESTPRSFRLSCHLFCKSLCYSVHVHLLVLRPQV